MRDYLETIQEEADRLTDCETVPASWLDALPALPLDRGTPVVNVNTGDLGLVAYPRQPGEVEYDGGESHGAGVIYNGEEDENAAEESIRDLRVDLREYLGFGHVLRVLLRRVANEDRARREWPRAWTTAQAFWQDYAIQCGHVTDRDRLRLAEAIAEAFDAGGNNA